MFTITVAVTSKSTHLLKYSLFVYILFYLYKTIILCYNHSYNLQTQNNLQKEGATMYPRVHYADLLRISAAFMVILLHVSAQYWDVLPVTTTEWFICHVYDSLCRPAVSIFVMLSGMFLLDPARQILLSDLFTRYCKKIIILLLFWTFFYATWHDVFWAAFRGETINWPTVIKSLQTSHYHLWYCYMLLGLYLILPFLRKIAADKTLLPYFLILCFCFTVILPTLPWLWVKTMRQSMYFSFTAGFTGYFLLGYYLRTIMLSKRMRYFCYLAGFIGLCFTIFVSYQQALSSQTAFGYYSPFTLNTVCLTIAIFLFYQYELPHILQRHQATISTLVENSLGIYLIHPFVLAVLEYCDVTVLYFNPTILSVPVIALFIFFLSNLFTSVIRCFPPLAKYLC